MRCFFVLGVFLLLTSFSFPQGSAGGYGQGGGQSGGFGGGGFGGGGGGFGAGGGRGGPDSGQDKNRKLDDEEVEGLWISKSAVLTPGDRVEFKLKVKAGETLLAGATSDAFDPALAIEDSKGTVLFKNDDRAEGDQSPFVIYRFPKEGEYLLKVLSYRSVSGGKFTLKMRTFVALDAPLKSTRHDNLNLNRQDRTRLAFRLVAEKGKTYDLGSVQGLEGRNFSMAAFQRIIGPTGVEQADFLRIPTQYSEPVFIALADGDYYIEYQLYAATTLVTDFRLVKVVQIKPTGEEAIQLTGRVTVVEMPVVPNLIVRTTLTGGPFQYTLSAPTDPDNRSYGGGDQAYGNQSEFTWFKMNSDSDMDVVRIFHGTGIVRFAIRSESKTITIRNSESLPTWEAGKPIKGTLEIGGCRLFLIKSSKSELMRVFAGATHFQARLDIFRLNGERANSLMDRVTHTAKDDLYFPDPDTFVVRLSCDGNGGSGDFEMKRDSLVPIAYTLGKPVKIAFDGTNFGFFEVNLDAGKRYQLTTDQPGRTIRADLLDEDGQFLNSQAVRFDLVLAQYFVPTRSGRHRLWLRGQAGDRSFKFELHVPPTIGG